MGWGCGLSESVEWLGEAEEREIRRRGRVENKGSEAAGEGGGGAGRK